MTDRYKPRYNGKSTDIPLGTGNGIGLHFLGDYRHDYISDGSTNVSYYFFVFFFLPIIPLGCYRIQEGSTYSPSHHRSTTRYKIYGTEKWKFTEVVTIYLKTWGALIAVLLIFSLIGYLIEEFSY